MTLWVGGVGGWDAVPNSSGDTSLPQAWPQRLLFRLQSAAPELRESLYWLVVWLGWFGGCVGWLMVDGDQVMHSSELVT